MSKGELVDSHVSLDQCRKAIDALHSHELKKQEKFEENQLLPSKEQFIWLNVTVKTVQAGHKLKPTKIPIVHPLVDPRTTPVCLITKDPQREYKDLLESHNIKFISRVVGIEKLKGKFKPFEARRMLLKENGLFLADDRVVPLLPKLLGSKWFEAKKQPIPVCLARKDLKGELERAISSTYMHQNQGTCTSIKVGKLSQKPSQILENIQTALPVVAKAIKGGWDNIQSLNVKTNSSMSLPIWSCTLDDAEGGRWHGLRAEEEQEDVLEAEEESEDEETIKSKKTVASKSRKRQSNSDDEAGEEEKPRKKAKAASEAVPKEDKPSTKPGKNVAVDVDQATQPKRRKTADTSPALPKSSIISDSAVSSGKKSQKAKAPAAPETASVEPAKTISDKKHKKSKKDLPEPTTSFSIVDPPLKTKNTPKPLSDAAASTPSGEPAKSTKKASKSTDADTSAASPKAVKPMISKDEVKQKRNAGSLEKKKMLVAKTKGGKSVKNAVLGRKVGQD